MCAATLTQILEQTKKGNFKFVSKTIASGNITVSDSNAIRIVVSCYNVCWPDVDDKDLGDVHHLLLLCTSGIEHADDNAIESYFKVVSHFTAQFLKKENLDLVLNMNSVYLPDFVTSFENSGILTAYKRICALIYNYIVEKHTSKSIVSNVSDIVKLSILILKMYSKFVSLDFLLNKVDAFYQCFNQFKIATTEHSKLYLQLISFVHEQEEKYRKQSYVQLLSHIVKNLAKYEELQNVKTCIEILLSDMKMFGRNGESSIIRNVTVILNNTVGKLNNLLEVCATLKKISKRILTDIDCTEQFQDVYYLVSAILANLMTNYTKQDASFWQNLTTIQNQLLLQVSKSTKDLIPLLLKYSVKCKVCSKCPIIKDYLSVCTLISQLGKVVEFAIRHQASEAEFLAAEFLPYFEEGCNYIVHLQVNNCQGWKSSWSILGRLIYHCGTKLSQQEAGCWSTYLTLFVKYATTLEGLSESSIYPNIVSIVLNLLAQGSLTCNEYKEALTFCAINMAISTTGRSKMFNLWAQAKSQSKKQDGLCLKHLTVVCVLKNETEVRKILPNFILDENMSRDLLLYELDQYKLVWKSTKSMTSAFQRLHEIADVFTSVEALVRIWWDDASLDTEVTSFVCPLLKAFELELKTIKHKNKPKFYLACLYYMLYNTQMKEARIQAAEEIQSEVEPLKPKLAAFEIAPNPNDECDISCSSTNLKTDYLLNLTKPLSKALDIFAASLPTMMPEFLQSLHKLDMFELIARIANEFHLHCFTTKAVEAWQVCFHVAKLLNNNVGVLKSIAHLVELSDVNALQLTTLYDEADDIISSLASVDSVEALESIVTFYVNKSTLHLRAQNIEKGCEALKSAQKHFKMLQAKNENEILGSRIDLLCSQYLILPCIFQVEGHGEHPLVKAHSALAVLKTHYRCHEFDYVTPITRFLFETIQWIAHIYKWMRLPREVRCYCKNIVLLSEKIVIPLRTAQLLTYLAHADLQSCRLDDYIVKTYSLKDILCLKKEVNQLILDNKIEIKQTEATNADIVDLTESFAEIMLDVPAVAQKHQSSLSSPCFTIERCTLPAFLKHPATCDCFSCTTNVYQDLMLMIFYMDGLLHVHKAQTSVGINYFKTGVKYFAHLKARYKNYSVFKFSGIYHTYCSLLLDYGNVLIRNRNIITAKRINTELVTLISDVKLQNMYLYNEALVQNLAIIGLEAEGENEKCLTVKTELSPQITDHELAKTPEDKRSVVTFPISCSPLPNSPPKRRIRGIKFKLLDDDKEPDMREKSPINLNPKTPAVTNTKIKIYKPSASKSTRKPKQILKEIQTPVTIKTDPTSEAVCNASAVVPSSPNAYTPTSLKVARKLELGLKSRTKLLTAKIKNTTAKKTATDGLVDNVKSTRKTVRKNLISELSSAGSPSSSNEQVITKEKAESVPSVGVRKGRRNINR